MKNFLSFILYPLSFSRRRRIVIEPNPYHIRTVFERSSTLDTRHSEHNLPWRWPRGTWFQRRRALRRGF